LTLAPRPEDWADGGQIEQVLEAMVEALRCVRSVTDRNN